MSVEKVPGGSAASLGRGADERMPRRVFNVFYIELLEKRVLLAASFAQVTSEGTLLVSGEADADEITLALISTSVTVTRDGQTLSFARDQVGRIRVEAGAGNDTIDASACPGLPAALFGEDGDDSLVANSFGDLLDGGNGADHISGGRGRDSLLGGAGDDRLIGGARNDRLVGGDGADVLAGGKGNDILEGDAGDDTLASGPGDDFANWGDSAIGFSFYIGDSTSDIVLNATARRRDGAERDLMIDEPESIGGTNHNDTFVPLVTANGTDTFAMVLLGRGGNDFFAVGNGDFDFAQCHGGIGNDTFNLSESGGTCYGDNGDDRFIAPFGPVSDISGVIRDGGAGTDLVDFSQSFPNEEIQIGDYANIENAVVAGGKITGTSGRNLIVVVGRDGAEVDAGGGNDTVRGSVGNDTITGGRGHDRLYGSDGDDVFFARDGVIDRVYGGGGMDAAQVDASTSVTDLRSSIETLMP